MNTSESLTALQRANPRAHPDFARSVSAAHAAVRAALAHGAAGPSPSPIPGAYSRRRLVRVSAAGVTLAAAAAAVAVFFGADPAGQSPGIESAAAAVKRAATVTAASAEQSGTVVVRITHAGAPWATKTVRWSGSDVDIAGDATPSELLVVGGTMYAREGDGSWVMLGDPKDIDPSTGTTPDEYLAAVRDDMDGTTLRRIANRMTGLTTRRLDGGSTAYRGTVPAGIIARESGFKEGHVIRILPWGYVAHGEAADPSAQLAVSLIVRPDHLVREIAVTWGSGASAWRYTVSYDKLGETAPLKAPAAQPLRTTTTPENPPG